MRPSPEVLARSSDLRFGGVLDTRDPHVYCGSVDDADHGVLLRLYLRVGAGRVEDARFQVFGCTTSIACLSLLAESVQGRTFEEARRWDSTRIIEVLALPEEKRYAAILAAAVLEEALRGGESKVHG